MSGIKITVLFFTIAVLLENISARPQDGPFKNSLEKSSCKINERFQDTCQKCAKITKSPVVYPLCCNDEDGVYVWCENYVYYGIH